MGKSLQEQLLQAGLVKKAPPKASKKEQRKQQDQKSQEQKQRQQQLAQQEAAKRERDREINLQRQQQAEMKARVAEVRQLIANHKQPKNRGEIGFNFTDIAKVKRLYVDEQQQKALIAGQLAIVKMDGQYEIVTTEVAKRIAEKRPVSLVYLQDGSNSNEEKPAEDDPYAAYQIPDDLVW